MTAIKRITVEEAKVKTATVEVKALTLSGKQVTLAVFRQLKAAPVIDSATGDFRGLPWGTVNYHTGECKDAPPHLHVVWQQGDELRQSTVERLGSVASLGDAYGDLRQDVARWHSLYALCLNAGRRLSTPAGHPSPDRWRELGDRASFTLSKGEAAGGALEGDRQTEPGATIWEWRTDADDQEAREVFWRSWLSRAALERWPAKGTKDVPTDEEHQLGQAIQRWRREAQHALGIPIWTDYGTLCVGLGAEGDDAALQRALQWLYDGREDVPLFPATVAGFEGERLVRYVPPDQRDGKPEVAPRGHYRLSRAWSYYLDPQTGHRSPDYRSETPPHTEEFRRVDRLGTLCASEQQAHEAGATLREVATSRGRRLGVEVAFTGDGLETQTSPATRAAVRQGGQAAEAKAEALRTRLLQRQAELDALDQLFIAV
ncbi:MAG: hypothetical protein ACRDI2_06985 [Chloroflexota bacterium]